MAATTEQSLEQLLTYYSQSGGSSCITAYLKSNYDLVEAIKRFTKELGEESPNIKSKQVRNDVQKSLKSIIKVLHTYTKIPDNGLVVCGGVVKSCL